MPAPTPTSPFHPELRRVARVLPRRVVGARTLPVVRRLARIADWRTPADVEVVPVAGTSVRLHRPPAHEGPRPAVLWIHGGGYVMGSAALEDRATRRLASDLGAVVAAVDYRLAPEHPFPTPLHDCHDALEWLAGRDDVDADRIAIVGASAGGGLAAALALLARDRGVVRARAQVLVYPMLDDRTATRRGLDDMEVRVWDNRANRFGWASYLGREPGSDDTPPLAAPARHDDLRDLPPAWIGVGTQDLFHDEDVAYAERLRAAGVACTLHVVDGAFHGFDALSGKDVSKAFTQARDDALVSAFAR